MAITLRTFDQLVSPRRGGIFSNIFTALRANLSGLNRDSNTQAGTVHSLVCLVGSVPVSNGRSCSMLNFVCRCLVDGFTTGTNGGTNRFCAPRRISLLVSRVITCRLGSQRRVGVCSPADNSNSLLVGVNRYTTQCVNGNGGVGCCTRRLGRGACGLAHVGLIVHNVLPSGVMAHGNSALRRS